MKRIPKRLFESIERFPGPAVVTGGNGMLGWDFAQAMKGHDARVCGRDAIDITDRQSVLRLREWRPKVVINCAAYTNVDGAESERDKALAINERGTEHLVEVCREIGAKLVHFSTDQVFDGTATTPRSEQDEARPSNFYAESKLLGEKQALRYENSLVLRVQWLYGEKKDRFTILRDKEVFTPFGDQHGAPTWTYDLTAVTMKLIELDARGLFHFAYDDSASWAEVFEFVKSELRLSTRLEPKKTSDVKLPARRPLYSVMSNRKLADFLGVRGLGGWREPLREFLDTRK